MVTDLPRTIVDLINVRVSQLNGCATCLPTPGAAYSYQLPVTSYQLPIGAPTRNSPFWRRLNGADVVPGTAITLSRTSP